MAEPSPELIETLLAKCKLTAEERARARECGGRLEIALIQLCLTRRGYLPEGTCDGQWGRETATAAAEFLRNCLEDAERGPGGPAAPPAVPAPGAEPAPVPPPPTAPCEDPSAPMRGIDISHHQGDIDFERVFNAGYRFVYIKATEGRDRAVPRAAEYARLAHQAGLWIGYYHFATPGTNDGRTRADDVADEAQFFLDTVAHLPHYHLVPALDLEQNRLGLSNAELTRWAEAWLSRVEGVTSKKPLIYLSPSFGGQLEAPTTLGGNPLWIAHYGVATPRLPVPWSGYVLHQKTDKGRVDGIAGDVDIDDAPRGVAELRMR